MRVLCDLKMKTYLYSISRRDIPLAQQSVQSCHAAVEHAYLYGRPQDMHPSLIHLTARGKPDLEELRARLQQQGHRTAEFHEPYLDWGLTAVSVLLTEEDRHLLKGFQLWRVPQKMEITV